MRKITFAEFAAEARRRFGDDQLAWKFQCPACGHVASVRDWKDAGAPETAIAFSCVGRWLPKSRDAFSNDRGPSPCNYAGGGLFKLNPLTVVHSGGREYQMFEFADETAAVAEASP